VSERGAGSALQDLLHLERHRIRDILLVSSLFDLYLFEEEGLHYELTPVSRGEEALALLRAGQRFDLVITTLHVEDMTPLRLARAIREGGFGIPIVLLAYDKRELGELLTDDFDRAFIWRGDVRLLGAIIRSLEDERNAGDDTKSFGVPVILVNEDSLRYTSFFLPLLYSEVLEHAQRLIGEGVNAVHRALRMRARPKILLSKTWEQAMHCLTQFESHISGVITDAGFARGGAHDARAGIAFAREVKERRWDVPVLLQSTNPSLRDEAHGTGAIFLWKQSPELVEEFRRTFRDHFGFGDFVFRLDGREVGRAADLQSLEEQLRVVPAESVRQHATHNDFSRWFQARTEFDLAARLRPRDSREWRSADELRRYLVDVVRQHRSQRQRGLLSEFSTATFDPATSFARLGDGSVGGKARGIAFVNTLLSLSDVRFPELAIEVPPGIVIATGVFDQFLDRNGLRGVEGSDEEIMRRFIDAEQFPEEIAARLAEFLELVREPLAVRSSSLLEDSQFHPFAGVYQTYMIPNRGDARLEELLTAIKRVYASTFYKTAREYVRVTGLRAEDEKMGVIVQRMVGALHGGSRFYPEVSGVARSYNFYPSGPMQPEDGIASVALGLGRTIVEGEPAVRFCPRYPEHLSSEKRTQTHFYALNVGRASARPQTIEDERIEKHDLRTAEEDGTLHWVASTWSAENDAMYDGISRDGTRVVTFAPILRHRLIPLAPALAELCRLGAEGIGTPVEIELAADLGAKKLGVLQMRPLVLNRELDELDLGNIARERLLCGSTQVLGHGVIRDLRDIVVVRADTFDRSRSRDAAREVAALNARLREEQRDYLLIGPGRWGSNDPLLGIPVKWDQISGARAIVESDFRDLSVDPSQGSHFFQNLTAFQVGYFSVNPRVRGSFIDWEWLAARPAIEESALVRHVRLERGVTVKMNGRERRGVILKGG
jgi:Pyruvate phosphate dikinase, AMP/ATP-binding domain